MVTIGLWCVAYYIAIISQVKSKKGSENGCMREQYNHRFGVYKLEQRIKRKMVEI